MVPSGSGYLLANWNDNQYSFYQNGVASGYAVSGVALGFVDADADSSGPYLLSHEGLVYHTDSDTYRTLPSGIFYRGTASGYCVDIEGNLYDPSSALIASGSQYNVFRNLSIYGSDIYSVNINALNSIPSGGGSWSSIVSPSSPYDSELFVVSCRTTPSGVGVGMITAVIVPSGSNDVAYSVGTDQILTVGGQEVNIWDSPFSAVAQTFSYGGNYLYTDIDGSNAIALSSSGVAFFVNAAGTWSLNNTFPLTNVRDGAIGEGVALACQDGTGTITPFQLVTGTWTQLSSVSASGTCAYIFPDNAHALAGVPSGIVYLELVTGTWRTNGSIAVPETPIQITIDEVLDNGLVYVLTNSNFYVYQSNTDYTLTLLSSQAASGTSVVIDQDQIVYPSSLGVTATRVKAAPSPYVFGVTPSGVVWYTNYSPNYWNARILGGVSIYDGSSYSTPQWELDSYPIGIVQGPSGTAYGLCPNNRMFGTDGIVIDLNASYPMLTSVPIGLNSGVFDGSDWYLTGSLAGGVIKVTP